MNDLTQKIEEINTQMKSLAIAYVFFTLITFFANSLGIIQNVSRHNLSKEQAISEVNREISSYDSFSLPSKIIRFGDYLALNAYKREFSNK